MTQSGSQSPKNRSILQLIKGFPLNASLSAQGPKTNSVRPVDFNEHPLFLDLRRQEALAARYNLKNPYYESYTPAGSAAHIALNNKILSNYTSYDYLGLNNHPKIHAAAQKAMEIYGTSVNGSRLTSGERSIHTELERALAQHYSAEDAITFASGHAGAVSALSTLAQPQDLILYDAYAHNCITLGAKYSGAARRTFAHNDLDQLETLLKRERANYRQAFIVSEGLFSMDGDMAPLAELIELKNQYRCYLMIDDAHGLGVLGQRGQGVFEAQGIDTRAIDLWFGTLSKALVSAGGYLAGPLAAIAILRAFAPGLVYSVGLSPSLAATALKALEIIKSEPERVARIQANSQTFLDQAQKLGFDTGTAIGAGIIPIMTRDAKKTLQIWQRLQEGDIAAFPVLPPGVPADGSRLRFFITADHTPDQITADLTQIAACATQE